MKCIPPKCIFAQNNVGGITVIIKTLKDTHDML